MSRSSLPLLLSLVLALHACGGDSGETASLPTSSEQRAEATPTPAEPVSPPPPVASVPAVDSRPSTGVRVENVTVKGQVNPKKSRDSRKGKPKRWLGLAVANMKEPIPGVPPSSRAMIRRVHRGGPGHEAGLRRGDVIIEAAGQPIGPYQDYIAQARLKEVGEHLPLKVMRQGSPLEVNVGLTEKPANGKVWRREHFPGTESFSWSIPSLRPSGQITDRKETKKQQLLYFWATWCGPCRRTSPVVDLLHRDAAGRMEVVAVSSEERDVIEAYLKNEGTSYPVAHDAEGLVKLDYEVESLPTIVWLDGDKVVAWDYGVGGVQRVVASVRRQLNI